MGETKSRYMTVKQFQQEFIDWSADTINRRVKQDGLPAIRDRGGLLFDRREVELWFKKRSTRAG